MSLRIYNTLTRKKEKFETLFPGKVSMYVCGPTVYDSAHIGHAMSAVVFDTIRRYLQFRGYEVRFVMNYTDVDDKIILRANKLGEDPFALALRYVEEYAGHLKDLNVLPATINPQATQEIPKIIEMVQALVERGHAYSKAGDVYFRVATDPDYGRLSGRKLEDMLAGARVEVDERKENPMDFALWKSAKPGEPAWDSPWGPGRPGWHIECSAMNLAHLGEQIDIHGGGNDLVFPHHENEIAQSETFTGKVFARYWIHNGMLQLAGEKMSKSLGNLVTINDFLKEHEADVFRMLILNSSYSGPLSYSEEIVIQAERGLERLRSALKPGSLEVNSPPEWTVRLTNAAASTRQGFIDAMDDDFNTAGALASLYELVRTINQARDAGANEPALALGRETLVELAQVLGLRLLPKEEEERQPAAPFIELLLNVRKELRSQKLWALSDLVRNGLKELGVAVEDTKDGSTWRWE